MQQALRVSESWQALAHTGSASLRAHHEAEPRNFAPMQFQKRQVEANGRAVYPRQNSSPSTHRHMELRGRGISPDQNYFPTLPRQVEAQRRPVSPAHHSFPSMPRQKVVQGSAAMQMGMQLRSISPVSRRSEPLLPNQDDSWNIGRPHQHAPRGLPIPTQLSQPLSIARDRELTGQRSFQGGHGPSSISHQAMAMQSQSDFLKLV